MGLVGGLFGGLVGGGWQISWQTGRQTVGVVVISRATVGGESVAWSWNGLPD
jgi:hypothetical protein